MGRHGQSKDHRPITSQGPPAKPQASMMDAGSRPARFAGTFAIHSLQAQLLIVSRHRLAYPRKSFAPSIHLPIGTGHERLTTAFRYTRRLRTEGHCKNCHKA